LGRFWLRVASVAGIKSRSCPKEVEQGEEATKFVVFYQGQILALPL